MTSKQDVPSKGGLSLYANLLNPSSDGNAASTISRAPVVFAQSGSNDGQPEGANTKKQINAAALRFQPTRRPQPGIQKPKPRHPYAQTATSIDSSKSAEVAPPSSLQTSASASKSTSAAWTAIDEDVDDYYVGERRQRGGRKKRKKNKQEMIVVQDWDDIYDPSRPNNYEEYKHSEERYREIREWKDRLYAHRIANRRNSSDDDQDDRGRPATNVNFAPPREHAFAPPTSYDNDVSTASFASAASTALHNDATGDDAYERRLRLSQAHLPPPPLDVQMPPPPPPADSPVPPPPPPADSLAMPLPPPDETSNFPHRVSSTTPTASPPHALQLMQPSSSAPNISRGPLRYTLPEASPALPKTDAELSAAIAQADAEDDASADRDEADTVPRSTRPGQKGFAARLMSKYGWTSGTGLGAAGNAGIVAPLRVQVEKRKKRSDAEGGGFVGPAAKGRIVGGKRAADNSTTGEGGARGSGLSEVVKLLGMLDGLDVEEEIGGGLMQEIGEECGNKYGLVERLFVDRAAATLEGAQVPVFIKFTSQLSALRAVNALEGRIFNGNTIKAAFFDAEKFEGGVYS